MFNNFPFLRILVLFNLFGMSLTACNGAPTLTAPELTSVPESTPIPSPTKTPTPTEAERTFEIDALPFSPDLAAALKKHTGLEASIGVNEAGNWVVKEATQFGFGEPQELSSVEIDASTLTENLTTKNTYGDTPTVQTTEGKTLYWSNKEGWYGMEVSPDIHNPVFVPFEKIELALRLIITEFNEPFSQEAIERWNQYSSLSIGFQLLNVNAKTGEDTRFAFLDNQSQRQPGLTTNNSEVQILDAWFTTTLPSGESFEFFPSKWMDPTNPKQPIGEEWKIFFSAIGSEIVDNDENRSKFDDLLTSASQSGSRLAVVPIVAADNNFFNSTNNLITFGEAQPSLGLLLKQPGNTINRFNVPNRPSDKFDFWLKYLLDMTSQEQPSMQFYFPTNQDPEYKTNFFPGEFQTILYPSLIIQR